MGRVDLLHKQAPSTQRFCICKSRLVCEPAAIPGHSHHGLASARGSAHTSGGCTCRATKTFDAGKLGWRKRLDWMMYLYPLTTRAPSPKSRHCGVAAAGAAPAQRKTRQGPLGSKLREGVQASAQAAALARSRSLSWLPASLWYKTLVTHVRGIK